MLLSLYFPISDFRSLVCPEFSRITDGRWDSGSSRLGHFRGVGEFRARPLRGFEGWVDENILAFGNNFIRLRLPRHLPGDGNIRLSLVRKASYFDGIANARFEFLFRVTCPRDYKVEYLNVAEAVLAIPATSRDNKFIGPLGKVGKTLARLWAQATVSRQSDNKSKYVVPTAPFVSLEDDLAAYRAINRRRPIDFERRNFEGLLVDYLEILDLTFRPSERNSAFREEARRIRTILFRMHQDLFAIHSILEGGYNLECDETQRVLREYYRHISRSSLALQKMNEQALSDRVFVLFHKLFPRGLDQAKDRLERANIRRQVRNNILGLVEQAQTIFNVAGDLTVNEGDRYENINVENATGVAIGTGAQATVTINRNDNLAVSLEKLAQLVRASGKESADVDAALVEQAAEAAKAGDEKKAKGFLGRCGDWVLDTAKTAGSLALTLFIQSQFPGAG